MPCLSIYCSEWYGAIVYQVLIDWHPFRVNTIRIWNACSSACLGLLLVSSPLLLILCKIWSKSTSQCVHVSFQPSLLPLHSKYAELLRPFINNLSYFMDPQSNELLKTTESLICSQDILPVSNIKKSQGHAINKHERSIQLTEHRTSLCEQKTLIFTSDKEVMFSAVFVCLSICW